MKLLRDLITIFTTVTTLIFLFSSIFIFALSGKDAVVDIYYLWGVLFIGAGCAVLYVPILLLEERLSKVWMLFSNIIYFVLVDALVMITGYFLQWFSFRRIETIIGIEAVIVIVFTVAMLLCYRADLSKSDVLNKKIQAWNKKHNGGEEE